MKKILTVLLVLVCLVTLTGMVCATDNSVYRDNSDNSDTSNTSHHKATKVDDVFKPYVSDEWIVSPDDEPVNKDTGDVAETDIKGVIACYDNNYLRVDILLNNSISFNWATFYAVKFEYNDINEYYTYYTDTKKLIYKQEKDDKIVKTKTFDMTVDNSGDEAGVSDSGNNKKNTDVYFIISKKDHIGGETGNSYFLTSHFYSGYLTKKNDIYIADETQPVELEFVY